MRDNLVSLKSEVEQLIWVYLWLNTENKEIITDYEILMGKFNVSRATVFRTLKKGNDFSEPSVTIDTLKGRKGIKVSFVDKKVVKKKIADTENKSELIDICKDFYASINYDYPNLRDHAKYATYIYNNLKVVCANQNMSAEHSDVVNTFKVFIQNIPNWWIDKKLVTLPLLHRHFSQIFNQIKNNGKSKFDKAVERFDANDLN